MKDKGKIDIVHIENDSQLDGLSKRSYIQYICRNCGLSITRQYRFKRELLCTSCRTKQTCIDKYGVDNPSKSSKSKEKAKETSLKKYGTVFPTQSKEVKEKTKQTCLKKYGVVSANALEDVKVKRKKTMLLLYGVENNLSRKEVLEKSRTSIQKKYGSKTPFESKAIQDKVKDTCLERYGVSSILKNTEARNNLSKALLEKLGVAHGFQSISVQKKIQNINILKYGTPYPSGENILGKRKDTLIKKYGTPYPSGKDVSEKRRTTLIKKYGVAHIPTGKFEYKGLSFDSSWELYYFIYEEDTGHSIIKSSKEFTFSDSKGIEHHYYPDFEVDGQLTEVKGSHFFENGQMINPYDRSQDDIYQAKYNCMLRNNVVIIGEEQIKECKAYVDKRYTSDFVYLFQLDLPFPYPTRITSKKDIIRVYHKSIYSARKFSMPSPVEAWKDKSLVLKTALNRLQYKGSCSPEDVRDGFSISKLAPKVSVFSPRRAEYLIQKYLNNFDIIFDPFSGFSGRMLGSCQCGKSYLGQDLDSTHVEESNSIIRDFNLDASVIHKDILTSSGSYPCLFTCPPYGNKEQWSEETSKSELSCDEWIDVCLKNFKCKAYLFVVDNTDKYKDYIVEQLRNKSHFSTSNELVILINGFTN